MNRMGWSFRGDDHPSLRSIASALLVPSASEAVKCLIPHLSLYSFSPSAFSLAARLHLT
jgi:hypothetical protein